MLCCDWHRRRLNVSHISCHTTPMHFPCSENSVSHRGVVVPECGGALFRQIFLSRNGAPVNIVYHKWNADTAAFLQSSGHSPVYCDAVLSRMFCLNSCIRKFFGLSIALFARGHAGSVGFWGQLQAVTEDVFICAVLPLSSHCVLTLCHDTVSWHSVDRRHCVVTLCVVCVGVRCWLESWRSACC